MKWLKVWLVESALPKKDWTASAYKHASNISEFGSYPSKLQTGNHKANYFECKSWICKINLSANHVHISEVVRKWQLFFSKHD